MRTLLATPFRRLALVLGATALLAGSLATVSLLGAASHEPTAAARQAGEAGILGPTGGPLELVDSRGLQSALERALAS